MAFKIQSGIFKHWISVFKGIGRNKGMTELRNNEKQMALCFTSLVIYDFCRQTSVVMQKSCTSITAIGSLVYVYVTNFFPPRRRHVSTADS